MKFPKPISVRDIAEEFNARIIGDPDITATGINEIHKVEPGDITFSDLEKYFNKALNSDASVILLNKEADCPPGKAILVAENPFVIFDKLIERYRPFTPINQMIHPLAQIHPTAVIEPNVVIGPHVTIGANSQIETGAIIREYCHIGERVIIQSGVVVGSDAFYFKRDTGIFTKWTSGGRVIIEDDVYIGANCTINRGVSGDTVVGQGTKIDCLVHVGHGAVIGKNCLVAAQVGISGKTIIGDGCTLYGQVGIAHGLHIGENVKILAKSGVPSNIEPGQTVFGIPADDARTKWREIAATKQLPDFIKAVNRALFENDPKNSDSAE